MNQDVHQQRFLAFDLEMTGLSPQRDSIIEIGAIPMLGSKTDGDCFFSNMQPYTSVSAESKRIHGIDSDDLWESPPAEFVLPKLFEMMKGRVLLGQKPELDLAFLWSAAKKVGGDIPIDWAIDIAKLFTIPFPNQHSFSLDAMARRVGIGVDRKFHNALQDARITARIFGRILPRIQKKGIYSIGKIIAAGKVKAREY